VSDRPITDPTQPAGGTSSAPFGAHPVSSSRRRDTDEQAVAMDRMYRLTRHVYDVTRRYYLLGRDRLLAKVATAPGMATLEVGCGTARNLVKLARRPEPGHLYGLDASHEMLETAAASIARHHVPAAGHPRIVLRQGLAEQLDARRMFGREAPFDTIFFSYCLSMVPTWPGAIEAALASLRPGGTLLIVDFWDQKDLPRPFAAALRQWLALFHVHYRPEVHAALADLGRSGRAEVSFESVARRYAYIATVRV
jgi:S-adenosylmethionine-diacylgycerolhomoserine-N-methlytransferase